MLISVSKIMHPTPFLNKRMLMYGAAREAGPCTCHDGVVDIQFSKTDIEVKAWVFSFTISSHWKTTTHQDLEVKGDPA